MIGKNSIVKNVKIFSERNAKKLLKNSLRLPRNLKKKTKRFHSVYHVFSKSKSANFIRIKLILKLDGFWHRVRWIYVDFSWTFDYWS